MNDPIINIEYIFLIQTDHSFLKQNTKANDWFILLKLNGEKKETNEFKLDKNNLKSIKQVTSATSTSGDAYSHEFHINLPDVEKVKKLVWILSQNLNGNDEFFIHEIRLKIAYRNELLIFPIDILLENSKKLILEPNLKPGETGAHYVVTTHTGSKHLLNTQTDLYIEIQLIGEKGKTKFIPLQHSQLNKHPFVCGKKDLFDLYATDVGRITKVIIGNHSEIENIENINKYNWFIDSLEVKTLNNLHLYSFIVNKSLKVSEEIILVPMNTTEIEYEVVLRLNEIDSPNATNNSTNNKSHSNPAKHMTDIYFIITGVKGSTKKINLNSYELPKSNHVHDPNKEKHFQFKSEDVGNILKINVSIAEDDSPLNYIYIDFIEVKIPRRSQAYKFPIERIMGPYFEDGKCELELEAWKHPERPNHIEYEILSETGPENLRETRGKVYLIIHGDHRKTGKIELNDGNFENSPIDNYEFNAPDVGKITHIELFYVPITTNASWQLESLQVKVAKRNEAYKFPVHCWVNGSTNYLELRPWKKPELSNAKSNTQIHT